jgi:3-methyladenine DNA glycosylase Tag
MQADVCMPDVGWQRVGIRMVFRRESSSLQRVPLSLRQRRGARQIVLADSIFGSANVSDTLSSIVQQAVPETEDDYKVSQIIGKITKLAREGNDFLSLTNELNKLKPFIRSYGCDKNVISQMIKPTLLNLLDINDKNVRVCTIDILFQIVEKGDKETIAKMSKLLEHEEDEFITIIVLYVFMKIVEKVARNHNDRGVGESSVNIFAKTVKDEDFHTMNLIVNKLSEKRIDSNDARHVVTTVISLLEEFNTID